jgi:hypothetical protein
MITIRKQIHNNAVALISLRIRGFGNAAMIHDLMMLMPAPAPAAGEALQLQWNDFFGSLDDIDDTGSHTPEASEAERLLTQAIRGARQAVLDVLKKLE